MIPSRDVQYLYQICDQVGWSNPARRTLDARTLFKLLQNEALAFRTPNSPRLTELVECFHRCQQVGRKYPENESQMLIDLIHQWFSLLDECFFFGALTRVVNTRYGRQPFVSLLVERNNSGIYSPEIGRPDPSWRAMGYFDIAARRLWGWLKDAEPLGNNQYRVFRIPIESALYSIVHEAIHAYLELFADTSHELWWEDVERDGGHGEMFRGILHVITERLETLTWSRRFREERYIDPSGPAGDPSGGIAPTGFPPQLHPSGNPPRNPPPGNYPRRGGYAPCVSPHPRSFPHGGFAPR